MVDSGQLAPYFTVEDEYFANTDYADDTLIMYIGRLMDELPERQRSCIQLCVMNGHSYMEASKMIGCSDQTVRRECLRALSSIKDAILESRWASEFDSRLPDNESVPQASSSFFDLLNSMTEEGFEDE
jgi:DNA-directed RNA polymerase specialized sigma24 family protein